MILTVTPNPSLDLLFSADRLVWDDANRLPMPRRRPGGQGVNVVRAARALAPERPAVALVPLGGETGREMREIMARERTPFHALPLDGETRIFVGVRERDTGRSMLLNPRGPRAPDTLPDALLGAVAAELDALDEVERRSAWVACCGSLLPGLHDDFYARVARLTRDRGARFVPDCDGAALAAAAPAAHLLVPNDMEAARLAGQPVRSPEDARRAGRTLLGLGPERVVITLGGQGAVSVSPRRTLWARAALPERLAREIQEGSAVGAGDAFLAALLQPPGDAADFGGTEAADARSLIRAVAAGTAVLLSRGAALVRPGDVERVLPHVVLERLPG